MALEAVARARRVEAAAARAAELAAERPCQREGARLGDVRAVLVAARGGVVGGAAGARAERGAALADLKAWEIPGKYAWEKGVW